MMASDPPSSDVLVACVAVLRAESLSFFSALKQLLDKPIGIVMGTGTAPPPDPILIVT
jgi:hypothetical protein